MRHATKVRIFVGKRIEYYDVEDAEESGAGADGERERQHGDDSKGGPLAQHLEAVD